MTNQGKNVREDSVLRFLRVIHENGLNLREGGSAGVEVQTPVQGLTQVDAAQKAGLSRPSVASYAQRMKGVLDKGRLVVKATSGYAVGVDISETHGARVALSDLSGNILKTVSAERAEDRGDRVSRQTAGQALEFAERAIRDLLEEWDLGSEQIVGVGISLPGPVKGNNRIGRNAGIWRNLSAADELARRLEWEDVPFETQSDSYLSALAENMWGGGQITGSTLFVKWAAQLRGAIIIDGQLYVGHSGTAGELPHQKVDKDKLDSIPKAFTRHGLLDPCPVCREVGCLHMIAPLEAVSKALKEGVPNVRASELVAHAERNAEARAFLEIAGEGIGNAIAPLVEALDPESVIIGGALGSRAFPLVFEALTTSISRGVSREDSVTVRGGRLQELTAVRGAVALALLEFAPEYLRQIA
jgi:predicted NBD/HSP70 family sugar kinase